MPEDGMSQEHMNDEREILYIPDEDGNEEAFEVLLTFELDETKQKYILVVPEQMDEKAEEDEVYAFRFEETGDDLTLYLIEDEKEWDIVEETFNTLMAEMEDESSESL